MISEYKIIKEMTLQNYLLDRHMSKSNLYKLITLKAISDDNKYLKQNDVLKKGSKIYINYSLLEDNASQDSYKYKVKVLFENNEIIAIDKEPKVLVHSDGNTTSTLLNAVVNYLRNKNDDSYIRPLHRIDFEASGVVVFTKNLLAYSELSYKMENNSIDNLYIEKNYLIKVVGKVNESGEIELKIGRDRHDSKKYVVSKTGKLAITEYKLLSFKNNTSLVEVKIITGRPHQIRVTFAYLHHPVLGDNLYNNDVKKGVLMLLSKKVSFYLCNDKITIVSERSL